MESHIFGFFGGKTVLHMKCSSFNLKNGSIHKKKKVTRLGSQKLHICPKVTKMESIIGHRIDYNGVRALRGQRHVPRKIYPSNNALPPWAFERLFSCFTQFGGVFHCLNFDKFRETRPLDITGVSVPGNTFNWIVEDLE